MVLFEFGVLEIVVLFRLRFLLFVLKLVLIVSVLLLGFENVLVRFSEKV